MAAPQPKPVNTNNNNVSHGVMLFGVRLTPSEPSPNLPPLSPPSSSSSTSFRKCMSMNNLAQYEQQQQQQQQQRRQQQFQRLNSQFSGVGDGGGGGYVSDDSLQASRCRNRDRKKGVPWTEDEHRLFLVGLNEVGKGDWRGISRNFVKTRTPTQVASHAQKYFLRKTNLNGRRRRSSLFDITTDSMTRSASADQLHNLDTMFQSTKGAKRPAIVSPPYPSKSLPISAPFNAAPCSLKIAKINLNQSPSSSHTSSTLTTNPTSEKEFEPFLSLKLPQPSSSDGSSQQSDTFSGFNRSRDNIIKVA
ncbi:hypothetical protein vseg_002117 [Gypsophila vaccaria]